MANIRYINKQEVLDLIISRISNMTYLANPKIPSEIRDAVQSSLSDLQYDVENLASRDFEVSEAEWVFKRAIKNGINAALPPICTNCKFIDTDAGKHTFCPNCGYKMKPPRFVGYLKGIK